MLVAELISPCCSCHRRSRAEHVFSCHVVVGTRFSVVLLRVAGCGIPGEPPTGKTTVKDQVTFGKLLIPAAKAAAADGKADVAKLLNLLAAMNSDPLAVTAEQAGTAFADIAKVAPVVQKDCGISLMQ